MTEQKNLTPSNLKELTRSISGWGCPEIRFILKARRGIQSPHENLGVFSASFNPPTLAHLEIVRKAQQTFHLKEVLLLVSPRNADKTDYEATLEERIWMLLQICRRQEAGGEWENGRAYSTSPSFLDHISIGVSSHPYFIDMVPAIRACYPEETEIYFIVGYDTFERILDKEGKYYPYYAKAYKTREEPLRALLTASRFIVAGRGKYGPEALSRLLEGEVASCYPGKVHYLELPDPYPQISATEVRRRIKQGLPVEDLVPPEVQRYLKETGLYAGINPEGATPLT